VPLLKFNFNSSTPFRIHPSAFQKSLPPSRLPR